jgi:hypothetical protein
MTVAVAVDLPIAIATAVKVAAKPVAALALRELLDPCAVARARLGGQGKK